MPNCLGINVEKNVIKYAKVFQDRDNTRIESCGIKFYDNLEESLRQIVEETYSKNVGISINIADEMYNTLEVFSLLDKKDLRKAVETEFDFLCSEKGYNRNILETRYTLVNNPNDRDKMKAVHTAINKTELNRQIGAFDKYKLIAATPLPIIISNLLSKEDKKQDIAILNIENKASLTIISRGEVQEIELFEEGVEEIFEKINKKENSYTKVYDIFKNTTLYTSNTQDLKLDKLDKETDYLDEIMPTLYNIITNTTRVLGESAYNVNKLYVTGTATAINNLDLYIQDSISKVKCEILKPYFVKTTSNTNIKDYIEANSAICLALQGMGEGIKEVSFKTMSFSDKMPSMFANNKGRHSKRRERK